MQPTSEKCSFLEEFSCKEDSLIKNWFCFNQNQNKRTYLKKKKIYFEVI